MIVDVNSNKIDFDSGISDIQHDFFLWIISDNYEVLFDFNQFFMLVQVNVYFRKWFFFVCVNTCSMLICTFLYTDLTIFFGNKTEREKVSG